MRSDSKPSHSGCACQLELVEKWQLASGNREPGKNLKTDDQICLLFTLLQTWGWPREKRFYDTELRWNANCPDGAKYPNLIYLNVGGHKGQKRFQVSGDGI